MIYIKNDEKMLQLLLCAYIDVFYRRWMVKKVVFINVDSAFQCRHLFF